MLDITNLLIILAAALVATGSPGPATLAIAGASMKSGRRSGLAVAAGVTTGSWIWSVTAALGLGAVMLANAWVFEVFRYLGACYLFFLAYKSARAAFEHSSAAPSGAAISSLKSAYAKGLALHLTNPKAVLFFGSLFAIGVPPDASMHTLGLVIGAVGVQSLVIFHGYALLFSSPSMIAGYNRMRRWFEGALAVAFGAAGLRILRAELD